MNTVELQNKLAELGRDCPVVLSIFEDKSPKFEVLLVLGEVPYVELRAIAE